MKKLTLSIGLIAVMTATSLNGQYLYSNDGRTNLKQSIRLATTVFGVDVLIRTINTTTKNRKAKINAFDDLRITENSKNFYTDRGYSNWEDFCLNNTCPNLPNWDASGGIDSYNTMMNLNPRELRTYKDKHGVLDKEDLNKEYFEDVKKATKDALYTGVINYGLNYMSDKTTIGRNVKNWWKNNNLPTLNVSYLSR